MSCLTLHRSVVRYTASVYGELAQSAYVVMDVESVLQLRMKKELLGRKEVAGKFVDGDPRHYLESVSSSVAADKEEQEAAELDSIWTSRCVRGGKCA